MGTARRNQAGGDTARRRLGVLVASAVTALIATTASPAAVADAPAQTASTARELFQEARALQTSGRCAEAIPKFEESVRLESNAATEFYLAQCHEETGRITSAYLRFRGAAAVAKEVGNTPLERDARARAEKLAARRPKLSVSVSERTASLPGVAIEVDGVSLEQAAWGAALPAEIGRHAVRARAPGKKPWEGAGEVAGAGATLILQVPDLEDAARGETPRVGEPRKPGLHAQRAAALVVGGLGAAGLVVGIGLGAGAMMKWNSALDGCPHRDKTLLCSPEATAQSQQSGLLADGSTAAFIAGGALAAGAVVLWVTAPSGPRPPGTSLRVLPMVGGSVTGGVVRATF